MATGRLFALHLMCSFLCSQEEIEREAGLQAVAGQLDRDAQEDFRLLIALTHISPKQRRH